jgi:hypothetical protein
MAAVSGVALLGVVSVLGTRRERRVLKWKLGALAAALVVALLFYHFQLGSF